MTDYWQPSFDPYVMLQQLMRGQADLQQQQAQILRHLAGISQNQSNLVNMYDDLNRRLNVLEAIFTEKI